MFEAFMVVAMPFIVKALTDVVKKVGPIPMLDYRVTIIRAVVAILSLVGALLTVIVGDVAVGDIDPGLIETAILTVVNAAVATWWYLRK